MKEKGVYTNIIYGLIFLLVIGGWAVSEVLAQRGVSRRQQSTPYDTKPDRGSMLVSLGIGLTGLVLSFLFPILLPGLNLAWLPGTFFIGLAAAVLGIALRWAAILTLGPYFTGKITIQAGHTIVQRGPYKWIRHPSYTGALLLAIGIGMMLGNWISIAVVVGGLFFGMLYRIPVEEQALSHIDGYTEYMQHTKRLIPFLF